MDDPEQPKSHPLDIPQFLLRDPVTNRAEFMSEEQVETEVKTKVKPAKVKANGQAKPKKAAKVAKAKPAKGSEKTKVAKPKAEPKADKDQFGLRKGSSRSKAAAMYARKNGATLEEVSEAVGSIQLNVLKELEANGWVVEKEKQERKNARPLTRYKLKVKT
jgi:hypothetical protein